MLVYDKLKDHFYFIPQRWREWKVIQNDIWFKRVLLAQKNKFHMRKAHVILKKQHEKYVTLTNTHAKMRSFFNDQLPSFSAAALLLWPKSTLEGNSTGSLQFEQVSDFLLVASPPCAPKHKRRICLLTKNRLKSPSFLSRC